MRILAIFLFLFLSACAAREETVKPTMEFSYFDFLQRTLPTLEKGLSHQEVERILLIPDRFKGIVLSEGSDREFSYSYLLDSHAVILVFDYSQTPKGSFKNYFIKDSVL